MGSLFDVPLHLALLLSLAANGSESDRASLPGKPALAASAASAPRLSEQEWLKAVAAGAGGAELKDVRAAIFKTSGGRYYVGAEAHRGRLNALRADPRLSDLILYDLARLNAAALAARLGRAPTLSEIYAAELLGLEETVTLAAAAGTSPDAAAAKVSPGVADDIAAAEPRAKSPVTVAALWQKLDAAIADKVPTTAAVAVATAPPPPHDLSMPAHLLRGTDITAEIVSAAPALAWVTEVKGE